MDDAECPGCRALAGVNRILAELSEHQAEASGELADDSVSRAIDWARSRDDGDDSPAKVLADAITSLRAQLAAKEAILRISERCVEERDEARTELAARPAPTAEKGQVNEEGEHCPNCPDQGWYVGGSPDDPEQIQCEFCYTVENSVFNRRDYKRRAEKAEAAEKGLREALDEALSLIGEIMSYDGFRAAFPPGIITRTEEFIAPFDAEGINAALLAHEAPKDESAEGEGLQK
jgi:hypothetical protein